MTFTFQLPKKITVITFGYMERLKLIQLSKLNCDPRLNYQLATLKSSYVFLIALRHILNNITRRKYIFGR